jgi:type I restriction enzyme S subunit
MCTNQGCKSLVQRGTGMRPEYVHYVLSVCGEALNIRGRGTTFLELSADALGSFQIPMPPLDEQCAIVAFLDRETAKIDGLVAEQERLIELLNEKRQAVVTHAVTRGMNPDAPTKTSGVDWLPLVPAHWVVARNKAVFAHIDERSTSNDGELMTVSHITGVTPRSEKNVNMFLAETLEGYKLCRAGDLVINTMWAWMGALGCSPCNGLVSPSYNVYRPRSADVIDARFYDYACRIPAHVGAMRARSSGVWESRLRLYPDAFLDMRVALPPLQEQVAIADFLDSAVRQTTELIEMASKAISLMSERRAALITAAVTGQLDVRRAA